MEPQRPEDVQATFCLTLVDELVRSGVEHVVVAPGSRSTPLALAVAAHDAVTMHVHHDERAAAFVALGIGRGTGHPAAVVTTSGTAAVELHPAVVEAHQDRVPLLLLTADRPGELRDVDAPQTVDQVGLYGGATRWAVDAGVPDAAASPTWRSLASRAVAEATGEPPGPVHLNLPFREPLVGAPGEPPAPRDGGGWHVRRHPSGPPAELVDEVARRLTGRRGAIVTDGGAPPATVRLAAALGWPILAGPRAPFPGPRVVASFDAILRHEPTALRLRPEVVVRIGDAPASRFLSEWTATVDERIQLGGASWSDPGHDASLLVAAPVDGLVDGLVGSIGTTTEPTWLDGWLVAERAARAAIVRGVQERPASEPAVAAAVLEEVPSGSHLVLASSMPIRDVEWYGGRRRADLAVHANRGANGIDGVVSTAVGVALGTGRPVTVLVGDVAFLHDANALLGLAGRGVDLTIVVVDNDGGGIFSFLPQYRLLDRPVFEQLFGTPHGVDLLGLAAAHGIESTAVPDAVELRPLLATSGGARVLLVRTDRSDNVTVHAELHAAVAAALDAIDAE
ncbi:MAG: 2-succinyl-5-enolpyruvyl-6-hydroxy-3-cyclohexene-1-carboxylic-acid synthase [Actinomycetota bacterium]